MLRIIVQQSRPALLLFLWLTLLTGGLYPLAVTGLARALFPAQAEGSLLVKDGRVAGSALVGQPVVSARYFQARPSATAPFPDNAESSSGSNLGPSNPALAEAVAERRAKLEAEYGPMPAPMDLLTTSASGLDPHISPQAAALQIDRVARERGLDRARVEALVARHTQGRLFGFWGEPRVNVLECNLALDGPAEKE